MNNRSAFFQSRATYHGPPSGVLATGQRGKLLITEAHICFEVGMGLFASPVRFVIPKERAHRVAARRETHGRRRRTTHCVHYRDPSGHERRFEFQLTGLIRRGHKEELLIGALARFLEAAVQTETGF